MIPDSALNGDKRKEYVLLGKMGNKEIEYLNNIGKKPINSAIVINDRLVYGKKAMRHEVAGNALSKAEWRILRYIISNPEKILYDKTNGRLL